MSGAMLVGGGGTSMVPQGRKRVPSQKLSRQRLGRDRVLAEGWGLEANLQTAIPHVQSKTATSGTELAPLKFTQL